MTLFSLSPNANSNFPDRFRRRLRALTHHELSPSAVRAPIEAPPAPNGHEFPATGSDARGSNGGRVYASKFKADLTSLMNVTRWDDESEAARLGPATTPENHAPLGDLARADDILGHLAALLASAKSGDATLAKGAAAALQAAALDGDRVSPPPHSDAAPPPSPNLVIITLQSLISAARSGDVEAARMAARNWARDLQTELAADARAHPPGRVREGTIDVVDPAAEAAYETLMEFTEGGVATAA